MDISSIEKFIELDHKKHKLINIHFKDRSTVTGTLVALRDYSELKSKNFWRLVNVKNLDQWIKTKDIELSRLFNGSTFTRISSSK